MYPLIEIGGHTVLCRDLLINVGSVISFLFVGILYHSAYRKNTDSRGNWIAQVVLPMLLELLIVATVGKACSMTVRGLSYPLEDSLAAELHLIRERGGNHFVGIVLASVCLLPFLYRRVYRTGVDEKLDVMAFFFPLQQVFNRIGCFMEGCCYGIPMSGPLSVRFPDSTLGYSVFPSQLFEAFLMAVILIGQWIMYRKGKHVFYPSMAAFGIAILVSECLMDQRGCVMYLGLTFIQIAALLLSVVAVTCFYLQKKKELSGGNHRMK